ncbi:hypothetical protein, partial [Paraburkholderia sp. SIMBA_053]|uniref:hypothetical protein n=1 Tax=Paraburkholderia sp. SIMBA_053 TaxID=3085794 RepID=UPI003979D590
HISLVWASDHSNQVQMLIASQYHLAPQLESKQAQSQISGTAARRHSPKSHFSTPFHAGGLDTGT